MNQETLSRWARLIARSRSFSTVGTRTVLNALLVPTHTRRAGSFIKEFMLIL